MNLRTRSALALVTVFVWTGRALGGYSRQAFTVSTVVLAALKLNGMIDWSWWALAWPWLAWGAAVAVRPVARWGETLHAMRAEVRKVTREKMDTPPAAGQTGKRTHQPTQEKSP